MSSPFLAEIRIFAYPFATYGWAFCDGALLSIAQNTALFALIGTYYGGDGRTTFQLPNLQGCAPIQQGQGNGLSPYDIGQTGGEPTHTLLTAEMATHGHGLQALGGFPANLAAPNPTAGLSRSSQGNAWLTPPASLSGMSEQMVQPNGSSLPHNNMMPYLTLNFCIALQGVFPPRS